jgi:hypothetical protein
MEASVRLIVYREDEKPEQYHQVREVSLGRVSGYLHVFYDARGDKQRFERSEIVTKYDSWRVIA